MGDTLIEEKQRENNEWKEVITYLENKAEENKPRPKLPSNYTTEEFQLINNILYTVTERES